ncbi:hypothetical protein EVAR_46034_1 [Eumeta japonica]|uniref:Uncharacterized protein n=1 Tax=Eumeta variegata TaxID=151549 RepID=A0A4C1XIJ7_EUMVA|nr:hypothetical protein EVAR_46034_1 [Eumeta japonica]
MAYVFTYLRSKELIVQFDSNQKPVSRTISCILLCSVRFWIRVGSNRERFEQSQPRNNQYTTFLQTNEVGWKSERKKINVKPIKIIPVCMHAHVVIYGGRTPARRYACVNATHGLAANIIKIQKFPNVRGDNHPQLLRNLRPVVLPERSWALFWDSKGVVVIEHLDRGAVVTSSLYEEQIKKMLHEIRKKQRGKLEKNIGFRRDNTSAHESDKCYGCNSRCRLPNT